MAIKKANMQVQFPTLNQEKTQSPVHPPVGGFFTLQNIKLTEPSRAFINNNFVAQRRAIGTIPQDAMTKDVHSAYWGNV